MNYIEAGQILACNADFVSCLAPVEMGILLDDPLEVAAFTVLCDDVTVVGCPIEVAEGQDVWVF